MKKNINRKREGRGGKPKGQGNPKAALTRGVLGVLTAQTNKAGMRAYDLMGKNFTKDINKVLNKISGLTDNGNTRLGERRGRVDVGFNDGYASGGSGGISHSLGGLFAGSAGRISTKALKGNIQTPKPNEIDMGTGGGSRSASDIMKVVWQRTTGLRHVYNKHLKKIQDSKER